ncbi:hypothetical protein E0485_22670 [Paenibacillus albiflavus]|uniref:Uncharacterized protein n=1 Tax=Paenibacillus albiflavus TaxID=2545760 RepID=A0A4R4E485_9BACL|nr:hypothetical protein [Paenibacillus albiflavus]TCZ71458.1 hypothetical protein E0485_22670 [Paenibacillus albiflavus]
MSGAGFFQGTITADERERLYNEIWSEPIKIVAKRYEISDVALRKHCIRFGIPLPLRGHWEKVKAGKFVYKPVLPKIEGELKKQIRNYVIKYKHYVKQLTDEELENKEGLFLLTDETKEYISEVCSKIVVKNQLRDPHPLIVEHQEEMQYRKKRDKEVERANFNHLYQSRIKSQYRDNKPTLPIFVSTAQVNRAYRIVDALIKTLPHLESRVSISHFYDKKDMAFFNVMHTSFSFELKEVEMKSPKKDKNKSIESSKDVVRSLVISITSSSSSWDREYKEHLEFTDTPSEPLEGKLDQVIIGVFNAANRFLVNDELKNRKLERKWAEENKRRRLQELKRREEENLRVLESLVGDWDLSQRIRMFADSLEKIVSDKQDEQEVLDILHRVKWAREKADWLDPLIAKDDELLGKKVHVFEVFKTFTRVDKE